MPYYIRRCLLPWSCPLEHAAYFRYEAHIIDLVTYSGRRHVLIGLTGNYNFWIKKPCHSLLFMQFR